MLCTNLMWKGHDLPRYEAICMKIKYFLTKETWAMKKNGVLTLCAEMCIVRNKFIFHVKGNIRLHRTSLHKALSSYK